MIQSAMTKKNWERSFVQLEATGASSEAASGACAHPQCGEKAALGRARAAVEQDSVVGEVGE